MQHDLTNLENFFKESMKNLELLETTLPPHEETTMEFPYEEPQIPPHDL